MRIRTIKPEFFKHDGIAALPAITRILFVGLWSLADCEGRLEDRPKRIKAEVLPYDEIDVESALSDLARAGFIVRYSNSDLKLIEVVSFKNHQRISGKEAEVESKYPHYQDDGSSINGEATGKHSGSTCEAPGSAGREGKGKERKGDAIPLPLPFSSEQFQAAWTDFGKHRSEIRKPLKPTMTKAMLDGLERIGEARAIAAIRHTIANGWVGLREPDAKDVQNAQRQPAQQGEIWIPANLR